jgi:tight adherence protein C
MTMISLAFIWGAMLLLYLWLLGLAWKQGRNGKAGARRKLHPFRDPARALIERPRIYRLLLPWLEKPQAALAALHGGVCTKDGLVHWASEAFGLSLAIVLGAGLLGLAAGSPTLAALGAVVAAIVPMLRHKELKKRLDTRRRTIVLELPELLSRLLLLVNAGETVMRALERCLQRQEAAGRSHPLYAELGYALAAVKRGEPLAAALEEFGRRCAVPEAKLFATTLLVNSRRGGETFVSALRELSRTLWERRKTVARTLGEQASSRMAFPLAAVFLIIMVLVGAPSLLMMSE